mgnify:CR=1 FL=1
MSNIFNRLELQAFRAGVTPRTKESREWFRKKASNMRSINREALMKEEQLRTKTKSGVVGTMQMFFYDPKHKDTLPYYDLFPLVIVVGPAEGGFYGLNLHYLPPILRAKMLDALMETSASNKSDDAKFAINYKKLQSIAKLRYYEPCFKHYLSDHIQSKLLLIEPPDWEIAIFLPTESFRKVSKATVWKESRNKF